MVINKQFVPLIATFFSLALAQFPIPAKYDGFSLNGPVTSRPVVLEAFFDLLCPGCKDAWPIIKAVTQNYSSDQLQLIVHPFPAPFHHNAYFAARGLHIAASLNESLAYPWLESVFKHQDAFYDSSFSSRAPAEVVDQFAQLAAKELGVRKADFLAGYSNFETDYNSRISFKYGCSRGVVATPTFLVNGVHVLDADDSWSVADWERLLNPLLYRNVKGAISNSVASE